MTKVNWIVDADIAGFFDAVSHEWLIRFVEHRVGDRRILRLIRKWLKAGVMEDGNLAPTAAGTPQGAVISPLLANIYLHYAFDLWADQWRKKHAKGQVIVVRYADDIVMGFRHKRDAERFMAEMRERLEKFALSLHPEKTRLIESVASRPKIEKAAGWASRRRSTFLGSLTSAAGPAGAPSSSNGRRVATGCGQGCERSKKSAARHARTDPAPVQVARTGRSRIPRVSRGADQQPMPRGLPALCGRSLATLALAAKPTGSNYLEPHGETRGRLLATAAHPSSLAQRSLGRQTPKVGARCVNHARRDLCGGAQQCASLPR